MLGDFKKKDFTVKDKFGKDKSLKSWRSHCVLQASSVFDGLPLVLVLLWNQTLPATCSSPSDVKGCQTPAFSKLAKFDHKWWQWCTRPSRNNSLRKNVPPKIQSETELITMRSVWQRHGEHVPSNVKPSSPSLPHGFELYGELAVCISMWQRSPTGTSCQLAG